MNALSGLMNPAALGQGVTQAFQAGEAKRADMETRNALSGLVKNPEDEGAMSTLAKYNPQAAFAMQDRQARQREAQAKAEQQSQTQQLMRLAMAGDPAAMDELAVQAFDQWKVLDKGQKDEAATEAKTFGNAAMDILNRPPEQRQAAVQAYAQQLGGQYPEIAQMGNMPFEQVEPMLRAAIAEAGMIERLIKQEQPDYMAIPEGGTLVDVRNPQAVQTFGQAPQAGAVEDGFRFRGGDPSNPDNWEKVGGGAGNGASGF